MVCSSTYKRVVSRQKESRRAKKSFFILRDSFRAAFARLIAEEQMNFMRVERMREIENAIPASSTQRIRGRGPAVGVRLRRLRLRAIARRRSIVRLHRAEVSAFPAGRLARSVA
jgi:hypothetical protein